MLQRGENTLDLKGQGGVCRGGKKGNGILDRGIRMCEGTEAWAGN